MAFRDGTFPRVQALICVAALLIVTALSHPVAETGIYDDWSYVRTAQLLASTGHVHYNGWATAMLGWQLYPAAVCFRFFGFSFTTARMTTLTVAAATTYLIHRCFSRCGSRPWNATWATLAVVLSPLFLPLSTTFMSDMFGLFAVVGCFYCCVRAVEAEGKIALAWLVAAAVVSVLGGTARQIAWLGVLVMVPSAAWLMRRDRQALWVGVVCCGLGAVAVVACMHWFLHQPFAVPEIFPHPEITAGVIGTALLNLLRLALEIGLLMLPLLAAFYPALAVDRRRLLLVGAVALLSLGGAIVAHHFVHNLEQFLVPTLQDGGNYVGSEGVLTAWPEHGSRPRLLTDGVRLCLTSAVLVGLLGVAFAGTTRPAALRGKQLAPGLPWRHLLALTVPFTISYVCLLTPRAAFFHPYDRYSLPLIVIGGLLLTRMYERKVRSMLPPATVAAVLLFGVYSTATTHDAFAMYRGTQQAVQEMLVAGVPETAIDAGWEYSGWTQVTQDHFVHDPRLKIEEDASRESGPDTRACPFELHYLFPVVEPLYSLSFEQDACGGRGPFPPVRFKTWLPWATQTIYVVRNGPRLTR